MCPKKCNCWYALVIFIYDKFIVNLCLKRSRDSGGESDFSIKQQLNSLMYVSKLINNRLGKLETVKHSDLMTNDCLPLESVKKINLPLDVILKNNVALSYFIDYISSLGKQAYLFLYLNIDGTFQYIYFYT